MPAIDGARSERSRTRTPASRLYTGARRSVWGDGPPRPPQPHIDARAAGRAQQLLDPHLAPVEGVAVVGGEAGEGHAGGDRAVQGLGRAEVLVAAPTTRGAAGH